MSDAPSLPDGGPILSEEETTLSSGPQRTFAALVGERALRRVFEECERLLAAGRPRRARALLERLVATEPRVPSFWCALVEACEALHDGDAARAAFARAVEVERALDARGRARADAFAPSHEDVRALAEAARAFADVVN